MAGRQACSGVPGRDRDRNARLPEARLGRVRMHALIQGVILGVLTGGVYALMASGQTLIFGIMKVVNLAQGAMVILAAYLSYQLFASYGLDPLLAIPVTTVVIFALGVAAELMFLRPLRREARAELR